MLILIVVCLTITISPHQRMPVRTDRYVELYCAVPKPAILVPVSYNILILITTAIHLETAENQSG